MNNTPNNLESIARILEFFERTRKGIWNITKTVVKNSTPTKIKILEKIKNELYAEKLNEIANKNGITINNFNSKLGHSRYKIIFKDKKGSIGVHMDGVKIENKVTNYYYYLYTKDNKINEFIRDKFDVFTKVKENKYRLKKEDKNLKKLLESFIKLKNIK